MRVQEHGNEFAYWVLVDTACLFSSWLYTSYWMTVSVDFLNSMSENQRSV